MCTEESQGRKDTEVPTEIIEKKGSKAAEQVRTSDWGERDESTRKNPLKKFCW